MPPLDLTTIHAGLIGAADLTVAPEHTAPRIGSGRIAVLATPIMINLIEAAALAVVEICCPRATRASASGSTCATSRRRRSAFALRRRPR